MSYCCWAIDSAASTLAHRDRWNRNIQDPWHGVYENDCFNICVRKHIWNRQAELLISISNRRWQRQRLAQLDYTRMLLLLALPSGPLLLPRWWWWHDFLFIRWDWHLIECIVCDYVPLCHILLFAFLHFVLSTVECQHLATQRSPIFIIYTIK